MDAHSELIELSAGPLTIGLAPAIGGSLAYFRHGGIDLMRPFSRVDLEAGNVLGAAMFPMLPYVNRIAGNAFEFGGRRWDFSPNNPPDPLASHGDGWKSAWQAQREGSGVLLSLDHIAPEEPYSYDATQHFELSPDGLTITMRMTNHGGLAMPFGFGLHPWFPRSAGTDLAFRSSHFFMEGPDHLVTEVIATPPELDFAAHRPLPDTWHNNDYGGWDGKAEIRFPETGLGLVIEADPVFGHLMLYADPTKPFFCLEPQSHAPDAFNRMNRRSGDLFGGHVLEPGESLSGTVGFLPFTL